jgi:hypothetical protein
MLASYNFHGKKNESPCPEKIASDEWRTALHAASTAVPADDGRELFSAIITDLVPMKKRDKTDGWYFSREWRQLGKPNTNGQTHACGGIK